MTNARRNAFLGVASAALVSAIMLTWAAAGDPPYALYSWLKVAVAGTAAFVTFTIWRFAPWLMAVGILVAGFGALILFGKMHREQWIPFDWVGVILFAGCAVTGLLMAGWRHNRERP